MKKLRLAELGFSSIFVLVGMLLLAVALPVATKLVQQNQENRSNAAAPSTKCSANYVGTKMCSGKELWKCNSTSYGSGVSAYKIYSWGKVKTCDCGCSSGKCESKTFYVYNSSKKRCVAVSTYCTQTKCNTAHGSGKCFSDLNDCTKKNSSSSSSNASSTSKDCEYGGTKVKKGTSSCVGNILVNCNNDGARTTKNCGSTGCSSGKCNTSSSGKSCLLRDGQTVNDGIRACKNGKETSCNNGSLIGRFCAGGKCNSAGTACANGYVASTTTCSSEGANCVSSSTGCAGGTTITGVSGCTQSNPICCYTGGSNRTTWYYDSASRSCKNNSDYASIKACEVSHNKCYDSESACKSANVLPKCTDKGGYCVKSSGTMTGGVVCTISSSASGLAHNINGLTNLGYLCSTNSYVCCMPSGSAYVGKCTSYPKGVTSRPDTTCSSGKVVWLDEAGYNGDYDWKCMGSNDKSDSDDDLSCKAHRVVDGTAIGNNSKACGDKGGICANFGVTLNAGDGCRVAAQPGTVITGLCPGNNQTVCCLTGTGTTTPNTSGGGGNGGGGNGGGGNGGKTVDPTRITLDPTSLSVAVGATATITAKISPDDASDTSVTWSSGTESVATVSEGVVTGKAVGNAVITAKTSNGKTATASANVFTAGDNRISFKFSLRGIKPSYTGTNGSYNCFDKLGNLKVDVVNSPTNTYQAGLSADFSVVSGETNDKGDQVFKVTALSLDSTKFASVNTFNYLKVKGPFHLKRRMCLNNQSTKLSETTICDISLASDTVYDFSDYTLLAGDLNSDGIINSIDYSYVKTRLNANADISCGREGDINMDGVVNSLDTNLIKEALSSKDDE